MITPVPRDIPLPLPANATFLEFLLIVAFIAHILFVNLLVGGTLLTLFFEARALQAPERFENFTKTARLLSSTITVNKSLAVVLGVAPLLVVSVLYTMHFYTANALTGHAWILLIPAIATTFLLLYAHGYTWERFANRPRLHLTLVGVSSLLLLVIPLVFLANVTLMIQPDKWTSIHGFFSVFQLPNLLPRYAHFLSASLILTSLFGVYQVAGAAEKAPELGLDPSEVRRIFYRIAFRISVLQFGIGPVVLFTIPAKGMHSSVLGAILLGVLFAIPAVMMMNSEIGEKRVEGHRLFPIVALLGFTVLAMASGRQMVRGLALRDHKAQMEAATEQWEIDAAQATYEAKIAAARAQANVSPGEVAFKTNCSACHGEKERVIGPPLTEIATIYGKDPAGVVTWARAPGKKRDGYPQMPGFAVLGDAKLREIADYMVEKGRGAK